jgi:UDP-glucose 4-epimerase
MHILVVGGAGYIGSHMVKMLCRKGIEVTILDNLSSGYRDAVTGGKFVYGDLGDFRILTSLFSQENFDGVMHFASHIQVGESVLDPAKYYYNNVICTMNLLDIMRTHEVKRFIFSSSAAIFGEPQKIPIDEDHPKNPINPYGRTKWMVEQILNDYDKAYGMRSMALRYFNAAGADPKGAIGERHDPESHLIPLVLQAASGYRPRITVFGRNYNTPDGTNIRDYIHVEDLCQAHLLAFEQLMDGAPTSAYNLGNGNGFSVQQVIDTACRISGRTIKVVDGKRRAGDPARLIADPTKAVIELGWKPRFADLDSILAHAWRWEQRYHK